MSRSSIHVLLVEDNPDDVLLTQNALQAGKILHTLHVVGNGVDAMNFLQKTDAYTSAPRPDLILLDLNLPLKSGREVLAEIKADASLKAIPVVILTTSDAEEDVDISYDLHANSYIVKPVNFESFTKSVYAVSEFWFNVVTLPSDG